MNEMTIDTIVRRETNSCIEQSVVFFSLSIHTFYRAYGRCLFRRVGRCGPKLYMYICIPTRNTDTHHIGLIGVSSFVLLIFTFLLNPLRVHIQFENVSSKHDTWYISCTIWTPVFVQYNLLVPIHTHLKSTCPVVPEKLNSIAMKLLYWYCTTLYYLMNNNRRTQLQCLPITYHYSRLSDACVNAWSPEGCGSPTVYLINNLLMNCVIKFKSNTVELLIEANGSTC